MNIREAMARLREHYHSWRDPVPMRRYRIQKLDFTGFPSSDDRDEFIKRQLIQRGFDLEQPIEHYEGKNNPYILFEQIGEVVKQHES